MPYSKQKKYYGRHSRINVYRERDHVQIKMPIFHNAPRLPAFSALSDEAIRGFLLFRGTPNDNDTSRAALAA